MNKPVSDTALPTAEAVTEYLRAHPNFFSAHTELLADLHIPHSAGTAVSLVEKQVRTLRRQRDESRTRIQTLIATAHTNDALQVRLHMLGLRLIVAPDVDSFFELLYTHLSKDFSAQHMLIRVFAQTGHVRPDQREEFVSPDDPGRQLLEPLIRRHQAQTGLLSDAQRRYLFPARENVASAAILPLEPMTETGADWSGVLVIGSADSERFHSGMATELLLRFAELVSHILCRHIPDQTDHTSPPHSHANRRHRPG